MGWVISERSKRSGYPGAYLGAYLVYGQNLDQKEVESLMESVSSDTSAGALIESSADYHDSRFPQIYMKRYGTDHQDGMFVFLETLLERW